MTDAFSVTLDTSEVALGDAVSGRITFHQAVPAGRAVSATLRCQFGQRGGGRRDLDEVVGRGPFQPGDTLPFAVTVPRDATPSFTLEHVWCAWQVRVSVEQPLWIDPKEELPLTIVGARVGADPSALQAWTAAVPAPKPSRIGCVLAIFGVFFAPFMILFPPLGVLLTALGVFVFVRTRWLRARIQRFEIDPLPRAVVRNEPVPVTVRMRLRGPVAVEQLSLKLRGTEHWTSGAGKSRSHHRREFFDDTLVGLERVVLTPVGEGRNHGAGAYREASRARGGPPELCWTGFVRVPADAPPTLAGSVRWTLVAHANVDGLPDTEANREVVVVGATLDGTAPLPQPTPIEDSSPGLAFSAPGTPLTAAGASDVSPRALRIWAVLCALGVLALAVGIGLPFLGLGGSFATLTAISGGATLVAALAGFMLATR